MQNGGTLRYSHCHAMAGLIWTSLTDREILNGLAVHLIWSFGTHTESPGFKKNPNVVYATNSLKITNFLEHLKDHTLRKYNFVNSFNVKTDFKYYKVLQGTYHLCMENAKYSARICLACFKIRWWIAERTFLTPFKLTRHCLLRFGLKTFPLSGKN